MSCGKAFNAKQLIDGRMRSLYRRRFCLECSPFGQHNTSRQPPGVMTPEELVKYRHRKRNEKTYRYQKKQRKQVKARLVALLGGRCQVCGYEGSMAALEFHHLDASGKEFAISKYGVSLKRLLAEAQKCELLCSNCHRERHAAADALLDIHLVSEYRRSLKMRAVQHMGSVCFACGRLGPRAIFDFHHWDAATKSFGIGQDGIPRRWDKVAAELQKCVMLCANCHREVHAGVRQLDKRLAEDAIAYAA